MVSSRVEGWSEERWGFDGCAIGAATGLATVDRGESRARAAAGVVVHNSVWYKFNSGKVSGIRAFCDASLFLALIPRRHGTLTCCSHFHISARVPPRAPISPKCNPRPPIRKALIETSSASISTPPIFQPIRAPVRMARPWLPQSKRRSKVGIDNCALLPHCQHSTGHESNC